jgi:hypothetical protein
MVFMAATFDAGAATSGQRDAVTGGGLFPGAASEAALGKAAFGEVVLGEAAVGRAALDETTLGREAFGEAALGETTLDEAANSMRAAWCSEASRASSACSWRLRIASAATSSRMLARLGISLGIL